MGETINNSINHKQTYEITVISAITSVALTGTYNGIVTTAGTVSSTNSRWYVNQLRDVQNDSLQLQFKLPLTYVAGTSIKILVDWHSTATTGNCKYTVGIGGITATNTFAGDTDMSYGSALVSTTPATADTKKTDEWSFSGSGFIAGENMIIIVYRTAKTDVVDTLVASMKIATVSVKYLVDKIGTTNIA